MLPEQYQWIVVEFELEADPGQLAAIARELEAAGNLEGAVLVYDRAYGLNPAAAAIRERRQQLLEQLSVVEHGIRFRYIPGGPFLMGCDRAELDEQPWHPVWLAPFWLAETPLSWAAYCRLMDWEPPPDGFPREFQQPAGGHDPVRFLLHQVNKIRLQYCEDQTRHARDWHAHVPGQVWQTGTGQTQTAQEIFGQPERTAAELPWQYEAKPLVAVNWPEAMELAEHLSTPQVRYTLPTEAQWEKAARGGLVGARYPWGNEPPAPDNCDFDRFRAFSILPSRTFPPNGYGLYAMCGGVWEWTGDWYDRDYYRQSPDTDPAGPAEGQERVLRGGSWADCAEVVTVTYRMSRASRSWRDGTTAGWGGYLCPNVGFRLCRTVVSGEW